MNSTAHANELIDFLRNERSGDGAHLGLSDAELCAKALSIYVKLRRLGPLAILAMTLICMAAAQWSAGFDGYRLASGAVAGQVAVRPVTSSPLAVGAALGGARCARGLAFDQ